MERLWISSWESGLPGSFRTGGESSVDEGYTSPNNFPFEGKVQLLVRVGGGDGQVKGKSLVDLYIEVLARFRDQREVTTAEKKGPP